MQQLKFFSEYLQQKYHRPLQRLAVDLALGCPNRSDSGFGAGCIFCAEDGSKARHLQRVGTALPEQIAAGKRYLHDRYQCDGPYLLYFQSFTSTNAPVARLRELYQQAIELCGNVAMLIISTRPDALPEPVLELLSELAERYEVWVELGIQSANDATLREINRGHDFACVTECCARLRRRGLSVAGHFILGLPGETETDWIATARAAARLDLQAVKLHQLMVLKHTELARRTAQNAHYLHLLNEYEYAHGLKYFLRELPKETLLMRLTADAAQELLIAPRWWQKKGQFLSFFKEYFHSERDDAFLPVQTDDGSYTLYHPRYHQHFHSLAGAESEALKKFVEPSGLAKRLAATVHHPELPPVRLLDVGFGLGGNTFQALACQKSVPGSRLAITALEFDLRTVEAAWRFYEESSEAYQLLQELFRTQRHQSSHTTIELLLGDARNRIQSLNTASFDLIYLDAFSPESNPELWTKEIVQEYFRLLNEPDGALLSYCSAGAFRGALLYAGFELGETPPFGRKRPGTIAVRNATLLKQPISDKEYHILHDSTSGVPYGDPTLHAPVEWILRHRAQLVERLRKRGVPKWYVAPKEK